MNSTFLKVLTPFLLMNANYILACSTCYGDPNSDAGKGMDMAIITLLGVITPLLIAIAIGIVSIGLKSKRLNKGD